MKAGSLQIFLVAISLLVAVGFSKEPKVMLCTGKYSHSYHKYYCRGLKQCKATIITVNLKEAIEAKHDPCDFCYGANAIPNKPTRAREVRPVRQGFSSQTTTQCLATTKKGTTCSRNGTANGYCWQHGK